jgi:hypothetical protein
MHYHAHLLGTPQSISDEDIAHFKSKVLKKGPSAHLGSTWRYYATLSGE